MKRKPFKHIIVAGIPRVGKTTICLELAKYGFTHYKMDSIKRGICNIFNLNQHDWISISPKIAELINVIIKENKTDTTRGKEYYVIDTCHLLPQDLVSIPKDVLIIYLGYKDISLEEKVRELKKWDKDYYWSYKLNDEELIKMVDANIRFSKVISKKCKENSILYFDTSYNRDVVLKKVLNIILESCTK